MNPLIQKYLPESLWEVAKSFTIPNAFLESNARLIQLILESRSLAEANEKQNRFNLLPIMSPEQVAKLDDILTREKQKLAEIEEKYAKKQQEINEKYQQTFNSQAYKQQQSQIQNKEHLQRQKEIAEADNLLAQM